MAVARRSDGTIDSPVAATTLGGALTPTGMARALPPADIPPADELALDGRLRRCTFRRLDPVRADGRGPALHHLVTCLHDGQAHAPLLGDVTAARPVCAACRAPGIFRPDEA